MSTFDDAGGHKNSWRICPMIHDCPQYRQIMAQHSHNEWNSPDQWIREINIPMSM